MKNEDLNKVKKGRMSKSTMEERLRAGLAAAKHTSRSCEDPLADVFSHQPFAAARVGDRSCEEALP